MLRNPSSDLARYSVFAKMQLFVNVVLGDCRGKSGALNQRWCAT